MKGAYKETKAVWAQKNKAKQTQLPAFSREYERLNPKQDEFEGLFEKTKPICLIAKRRKLLFEKKLWQTIGLWVTKKQSQSKFTLSAVERANWPAFGRKFMPWVSEARNPK